jgi:hypothetical protein
MECTFFLLTNTSSSFDGAIIFIFYKLYIFFYNILFRD